MLEDDKNLNRLDAINKKLFSEDEEPLSHHRRGVLHQNPHTVSDTWKPIPGATKTARRRAARRVSPIFKWFLVVSILFFLGALGFGAYTFIHGGNTVSSNNIALSILGNAFTPGGDPLPIQIEVTNRNNVALESSDLIIEYSRGGDVSNPTDTERIQKTLGTIAPGSSAKEDVSIVLFGTQGTTRDIKVTLEYRVNGSSATFTKEKLYSVNISSSPISIMVDSPEATPPNQDFSFVVKVVPNSDKVIPNMLLKVEYPAGFNYKGATPEPSYLSNIWNLGDINPGTPKEIRISGTFNVQEGEERSFKISTGSADSVDKNEIGIAYNSLLHTVIITKPFLETQLTINGSSANEIVASAASHLSPINVNINWANNQPVVITNATFKLTIKGDFIERSSINMSNGVYNALDDNSTVIVWDKDTINSLATVVPGQSGNISLSFLPRPIISGGQVLYQNPHIDLTLDVSGTEPLQMNAQNNIQSVINKTIKFATDFQLAGSISHITGQFLNTGPIPPQANQKTTYTVEWSLLTTVNDMSNIEVRALLPFYVHFLSIVYPLSENIHIDSTTGEIVWKVGFLPKGTGYTLPRRSVSFQIELVPSLSQVGSAPSLILEAHAIGQDTYTNAQRENGIGALNTRLTNEPNYKPGDEIITN